jgi:hypothetical protein
MFGSENEGELLKNAVIESTEEQEATVDTDEGVSADTATAEGTGPEETQVEGDQDTDESESDDQDPDKKQKAIDKRFAKMTAEKHALKSKAEEAAERERAAAERARVAEEKLEALMKAQVAPIPAPHPDLAYTDPEEFQRQQDAYFEQRLARQNNANNIAEQKKIAEQMERDRQAAIYARLKNTSKELGITPEEVEESASVLVNGGISDLLREMLLEHEASPALMTHLARNEETFAELNGIRNPLALARRMDALQEKAVQRKISNAPAPTRKISGSSAKEQDEFKKALPRATIE